MIDWPVLGAWAGIAAALVAAATLAAIVWLAIRGRPRLRLSVDHGTLPGQPAWKQQVPVVTLTIRNYGAPTILRRGWVRWGPGGHEISWNLPVTDIAIPGGGLLVGAGPPVEVSISINEVSEATGLNEPLEIGVEDRTGNSVGLAVPSEFRALFRSGSSITR